MDASLETLVIAAYVFACALSIPRTGPPGKVTDQELIALAVAQAATGMSSDRQFLGVIGHLLPGFFPALPGQSQYNRRLRRLTPQLTTVQLMVAELIADGRVRLVDGSLIACAKGVPVGYDLVGPKTGQERERALELAAVHAGSVLFADKGFWGREYRECMELIDIRLITPERHRPGPRPFGEIAKARIRLVIESVFSNLKRQMRMEDHLAKTLSGLAQRIVQRLLALTLGMLINTRLGRPPRALAAYDGR